MLRKHVFLNTNNSSSHYKDTFYYKSYFIALTFHILFGLYWYTFGRILNNFSTHYTCGKNRFVNVVPGQSVVSQMMQGPLDMVVGLTAGALWGVLSGFLPHMDDVSSHK